MQLVDVSSRSGAVGAAKAPWLRRPHCRRSAARCSRRLSVVNCCSAPTPPAVRMIATRSPARSACRCICERLAHVEHALGTRGRDRPRRARSCARSCRAWFRSSSAPVRRPIGLAAPRGRCGSSGAARARGPCLRLVLRADVEGLLERLVLAADGDVEVVTRQVRDGLSVAIRHDGVDGDQVGGCAEDGRILGADLVLRRERDAEMSRAPRRQRQLRIRHSRHPAWPTAR